MGSRKRKADVCLGSDGGRASHVSTDQRSRPVNPSNASIVDLNGNSVTDWSGCQDERRSTGFFDLPAELRNSIYQMALIRPKITITSAPKEPLKTFGELETIPTFFREKWRNTQPLSRPVQRRSCWLIDPMRRIREMEESNVSRFYGFSHKIQGGIKSFHASYEIKASSTCASDESELNLSLLRASKQVYHEAAPIFYKNNTFNFETRWEDLYFAPMTFLSDQSSSWELLRTMNIDLALPPPYSYTIWDDDDGFNSATDFHPPPYFNDLAKALKKVPLRHFGLTFRGAPHDNPERGAWQAELRKLGPFASMRAEVYCGPWNLAFTIPEIVDFCALLRSSWVEPAQNRPPPKVMKIKSSAESDRGYHLLKVSCEHDDTSRSRSTEAVEEILEDIVDWQERGDVLHDPQYWAS